MFNPPLFVQNQMIYFGPQLYIPEGVPKSEMENGKIFIIFEKL